MNTIGNFVCFWGVWRESGVGPMEEGVGDFLGLAGVECIHICRRAESGGRIRVFYAGSPGPRWAVRRLQEPRPADNFHAHLST